MGASIRWQFQLPESAYRIPYIDNTTVPFLVAKLQKVRMVSIFFRISNFMLLCCCIQIFTRWKFSDGCCNNIVVILKVVKVDTHYKQRATLCLGFIISGAWLLSSRRFGLPFLSLPLSWSTEPHKLHSLNTVRRRILFKYLNSVFITLEWTQSDMKWINESSIKYFD